MKKILLVAAMLFMIGCDGKPSGQSGKDYVIDELINETKKTEGFDELSGYAKANGMKTSFDVLMNKFFSGLVKNGQCTEEGIRREYKNSYGDKDAPIIGMAIALIPELCENGVYVESKERPLGDYANKRFEDEFIAK